MNNPEATRFVRERLGEAGIANHEFDVRSRDMGNVSGECRNTVRTAVCRVNAEQMEAGVARRIERLMNDLPGYTAGRGNDPYFVVAYWNGGS